MTTCTCGSSPVEGAIVDMGVFVMADRTLKHLFYLWLNNLNNGNT